MVTITREQSTEITETLEDMVEYLAQSMWEQGTPMAGETLWKVVSAFALAKEAQFEGRVV